MVTTGSPEPLSVTSLPCSMWRECILVGEGTAGTVVTLCPQLGFPFLGFPFLLDFMGRQDGKGRMEGEKPAPVLRLSLDKQQRLRQDVMVVCSRQI